MTNAAAKNTSRNFRSFILASRRMAIEPLDCITIREREWFSESADGASSFHRTHSPVPKVSVLANAERGAHVPGSQSHQSSLRATFRHASRQAPQFDYGSKNLGQHLLLDSMKHRTPCIH